MQPAHYFNPDLKLKHHYQIIDYSLAGQAFQIETDNGVFSKDKIDYGTHVMLKAILADKANYPLTEDLEALDFACGYGIVSIVLQTVFIKEKYFLKQNWQGLDINPRAVALAKKNADRAGLSIDYQESDGLPEHFGNFDIIVFNPPIRAGKSVYYPMFEQAAKHLTAIGNFYLVMQKKQGVKSAVPYLATLFDDVMTIDKSGGYHTVRCCKPKG